MTAHTRIAHMTGAERVGEFEAFAGRIRARHPKPEVAPLPDTHESFGFELEPERMKVSRGDRDYILGDY